MAGGDYSVIFWQLFLILRFGSRALNILLYYPFKLIANEELGSRCLKG